MSVSLMVLPIGQQWTTKNDQEIQDLVSVIGFTFGKVAAPNAPLPFMEFTHNIDYALWMDATALDDINSFYKLLITKIEGLPSNPYLVAKISLGAKFDRTKTPLKIGLTAARAGWENPPKFRCYESDMYLSVPSLEMGTKFKMLWLVPD